ncbi:type I secretion C-terminal target domain-containing protein, partial [Vibrio ouci]
TIIDDGGEVNNDTPVLTVSDAGQVVEGNDAQFDVSLDKEVDGTLNYVFTLDVDDPLTAEMADFLDNGELTVSYTDSNGPQTFVISNGGNLNIPGDATNMTVTVGTLEDDTFEGAESFNLDVTVTGSIGNENEALNLSDSGSANIVEFTVEGPVDIELQDANTVGDSTDVNSSDLTFSAGENDIVSYEFGSTVGISVSGLDGSISWSVDNNGKLIGSVNNVALLSIALIGGTISAGTMGSVTVEATLLDNMQHEIDTDNLSINGIIVNAVDSESDAIAATVNIDVADDLVSISTGDLTTYNQPGTYVGNNLIETAGADTLYSADLSGNIQGWDPDNGVTFSDSGLSSSGTTLYYYVDPNQPDVLYAYTDTADDPSEFGASPGTQELVFTLTADPNNNRYQIELERAIDSISSVAIADLTEGEGGINNIVYVGFNPDLDPDFDLDYDFGQLEPNYELAFTLTAISSDGTEGNVNGSNNGFGVDNPAVDVDEVLIVDFVDDVAAASFSFTGSIFAYFVAYDTDGVVVDSGDFFSGESLVFNEAVSYVELTTSSTYGDDNFQFIGASADVIESAANDVSLQFDVTVNDSDGDSTSGNFTIDLNAPSEMTLTGTDNDGRLIGSEGDDTFIGNGGADLFTVLDGYLDGSTDVIKDFDLAEGDKVDISDLFDNLTEQDVTDIMADIAATVADKLDESGATVEIEDSNNNTLVIEFEGLAAVDLSQDLQQIFIVKDD